MTLHEIARALVRDGKGIFAADEGMKSGDSLFSLHGISVTEELFTAYRGLLLTTEGIEEYLSGVILPAEALNEISGDGTPLYDLLGQKDIFVGVNAESIDATAPLADTIQNFRSLAVSFLKYKISADVGAGPADTAYKDAVRAAIEFGKICQSESVVPVFEIDMNMDGPHTAAQAEDTLVETLSLLSDALESGGIDLAGAIVAASMAATGLQNPLRANPPEVAERTVRAVTSSLSETLAGVVFTSGLQKPEEATANLNAIARLEPFPWPMTYLFSDAFENPVLALWQGKEENVSDAQAVFLERISLAESADAAGYSKGMDDSALGAL